MQQQIGLNIYLNEVLTKQKGAFNMADNIKMDSHKLMLHPQRVAEWMQGKNIYPIELEIGLTNTCNHRCIFCAVDYTEYKPIMLDKQMLLSNLKELSVKGLKSIIYAGEGEPLVNKESPEIINATKGYNIDVAMSTNGVLLTKEVSKECLKALSWIRFSMSGIENETYESIHRCKKGDLQRVLANLQEAVKIKQDQKLQTTLGAQLLLLSDNEGEIVSMAKQLREIGIDYFTIKPFSQHPESKNKIKVDYSNLLSLEKELDGLQTNDYKIYFRANAMKKLECKRDYDKCRALPFMVYIDAKGNIWPCITFLGKEEIKYGNLYEKSFIDIWESKEREQVIKYFDALDLEKNCREICRLDEMNKYLHELTHPSLHVNFI
jgi:radical SAM protein with 4Fe4S-binding SPASM domain